MLCNLSWFYLSLASCVKRPISEDPPKENLLWLQYLLNFALKTRQSCKELSCEFSLESLHFNRWFLKPEKPKRVKEARLQRWDAKLQREICDKCAQPRGPIHLIFLGICYGNCYWKDLGWDQLQKMESDKVYSICALPYSQLKSLELDHRAPGGSVS